VLSEPGILVQNLAFVLPGEFTSGPQAEGEGGAAGAARGSKGRLLLNAPWSGFGSEAPDYIQYF
jgi:hypothetical protein